jgi:hypothetical protein
MYIQNGLQVASSRRLYVALWAKLHRGSFLEVILKIETRNSALLSG